MEWSTVQGEIMRVISKLDNARQKADVELQA